MESRPARRPDRRGRAARRGLSLAESVTAMAVLTVAGGAALSSLAAGVQGATDAARRAVAAGLADDLADEAFAFPVRRGDSFGSGANSIGASLPRTSFRSVDDFAGWSARPPVAADDKPVGVPGTPSGSLGDTDADLPLMTRFRRSVAVERVKNVGTNAAAVWEPTADDTPHRRVTVTVAFEQPDGSFRTLAERAAVLSRGGA